ncbi:uncharacterized protein PHACADRAFT_257686 [Phanerochaete carnosa HHB-10118-sp]|uniref:Uncharacterized protein n=1 Tax=Phanerochaete carnosa (strain HHB-10118-sp) TaxID=650164 RepID=K5WUF2_PHACS|nr:uncharacterized protein PHACADRAFT_257686 [Phanerochaete carnosa HHB-10118-sp]EKM54082.1 hypothetical protein PHACADRAFT_257686 [Phanerochaete carnosa HHB-10118-sp]
MFLSTAISTVSGCCRLTVELYGFSRTAPPRAFNDPRLILLEHTADVVSLRDFGPVRSLYSAVANTPHTLVCSPGPAAIPAHLGGS